MLLPRNLVNLNLDKTQQRWFMMSRLPGAEASLQIKNPRTGTSVTESILPTGPRPRKHVAAIGGLIIHPAEHWEQGVLSPAIKSTPSSHTRHSFLRSEATKKAKLQKCYHHPQLNPP